MTEPILRRDVLNYLFQPTPRAPMLTGAAGEIRMPERLREQTPPRFGSSGLLNIDPAAAYTGLLAPGGDPQSNAPRARLGVIQGLMNAPEALLDATAGTTRRFMQGEVDPNSPEAVRQGVNAAMAVGGPGLLATRPGLGVFGRNPKAAKMEDFAQTANAGNIARKFEISPNRHVWTDYYITRNPDSTVDMDLSFLVQGRNTNTGNALFREGTLTKRERLKALNLVISDFRRRATAVRPNTVTFHAARDDLIPFYDDIVKKLEDEFQAVNWSEPGTGLYELTLPNPRKYDAETVKGLLSTK